MKRWLAGFAAFLLLNASAATEWEVRDVDHPVLGAIRVAVPKNGVSTAVGELKIVSAAFVSCEKRARKIAIELANSLESDTRGGLAPAEPPRLVCNQPGAVPQRAYTSSEIAATWETNDLGDSMARGLSPGALRQCGSIDVLQRVKLPEGTATRTQLVAMSLAPSGRDLDAVFTACGEQTAFAAARAPVEPGWKTARTVAQGRTNVRRDASIDSPVVAQLPPSATVFAQPAAAPWWRVKPTKGNGFTGYVREDRLQRE